MDCFLPFYSPPHPLPTPPMVPKNHNFEKMKKALEDIILQMFTINDSPGFNNWHMLPMYVCLLLLPYAWFWTCVHWEVHSFFSLWFFKVFKIFLALMILYCLKTCYIFDLYLLVLARDRFFTANIYFKETLFSDFSYKLFNKYSSLLQSTCWFRASISKITGIELSDSGSWITNRFWYVLNQKQHFLNFFTNHK